jgi:hypothetical protein
VKSAAALCLVGILVFSGCSSGNRTGNPAHRAGATAPAAIVIPTSAGKCVIPRPVAPPGHPLTVRPELGCWDTNTTDLAMPLAVFKGPVVGRFYWESGGVDSANGHPVVGARVTLTAPTLQEPLRAVTDKRGQYAFVNIPLRGRRCVPATVRVRATGFRPVRIGPDPMFRGADQRSITIGTKRNLSEGGSGCRRD